jgi:hypothetical protein
MCRFATFFNVLCPNPALVLRKGELLSRCYLSSFSHSKFPSVMQKANLLVTNVSTSGPDPITNKILYAKSIIRGRGDAGYLLTSGELSLLPNYMA